MGNYENCQKDEFEIRKFAHVTDRTDGDTTETTTAPHRGRHCRCQTENPQMYISKHLINYHYFAILTFVSTQEVAQGASNAK
jgi:hypothetical protein